MFSFPVIRRDDGEGRGTIAKASKGGMSGDDDDAAAAAAAAAVKAGAAELAFGTDKERHVGAVLILPEHRVETHLLEDGSGVIGAGVDDAAAGGLSKLSLLDHPPPGINMII